RRPVGREPFGNGADRFRLAQHPDLDRPDVEVTEHGIHLCAHEVYRDVENTGDALRILGGQCGDDRCTVDAKCGEGLEVGLNAGATARIRPRNGESNRCGHDRDLLEPETRSASVRAAASTSVAPKIADTTATPSAPAAMTSGTVSAVMPAIATAGADGARPLRMRTMRARPCGPIGGSGLSLLRVG